MEQAQGSANLIAEMQTKLVIIIEGLRVSGLKVNESKTELCLFYQKDQNPIQVILNKQLLTSKPSVNILGISFDCKLNWQIQLENSITKAKRPPNAIKLIHKHFNRHELLTPIKANY